MRVGILANGLSGGGAERQAAQWAAVIARWSDVELRLLTVDHSDRLYALPEGVEVVDVHKRHAADLVRVARAVRGFVRDLDLAICFQPYSAIFCIGTRTPVLLVTGDDPRYHWDASGIPNRVIDAAFRNAVAASAPAPELVDCYRERGVRTRGPWLCIPNIVDDAGFVVAPPQEKRGALFVGRLEAQKDPLLAVESALAGEVPLTVLGEGSLHDEVARRAQGTDVVLHPFTSRPWELYARHRVLLLSSEYEPFGNVIVESLAAGTPVVAVDCDFGPRFVLDGARFSSLVAGRDPRALGQALRAVVERPYGEEEACECAEVAARYRPDAVEPQIRDAVTQALSVPFRRGR